MKCIKFPFLICGAFAIGGLTLAQPSTLRGDREDGIYARLGMEQIELPGLRVWIGSPIRVTSQLGWQSIWPHGKGEPEGSFIHLTPVMARFPRGNLIATYAMDADNQDDPLTVSAFQISKDGGRHWGRRYSVLMQHNPMIFIPQAHDSLLGVPSELNPLTPGDDRNFVGVSWHFQEGGDQLLMVPEGIRVVDWPWPLATFPSPQPTDNWQAGMRITGSVTERDGQLLITAEVQKKGDVMNRDLHAVLLASKDSGRTWRYFSTLGDPDPALDTDPGYEGPNEPFVLPLADGSLMGVYRVGSGKKWHLRRRYSRDGGLNWSATEVLPAWSVKPQLVRIPNGTIALTTGRPGIYLWLATDARATAWQKIDLVEHHNKFVPGVHDQIHARKNEHAWQTTSYTGLVDMGNNRMLVAYDRDPEQLPSGPEDRSSVFVVPIEVERQ